MRVNEETAVRRAATSISANIIFEHPSIHQLAYTVLALIDPSSEFVRQEDQIRLRVAEIEAMVTKYTTNLPVPQTKVARSSDEGPVVLLTGSTGNIGSHILAYLLSDSRVGRVYALNRPSSDPVGRLRASLADRELSETLLEDPRFVSLVGDVTQDRFGLEATQYDEVCLTVSSELG